MENVDKLVFVLPDNLEYALWSIPVLIQHLADRLVTHRKPESITTVSKIKDLHKFLECCWHGMNVVEELGDKEREEADVVFEFQPDICYRLTKDVEKHITESFGIQLGTVLWASLPPVAMDLVNGPPGLVLFASRHDLEGRKDWEWKHKIDFINIVVKEKIPIALMPVDKDWNYMKKLISASSVVVGVRGTATLVASAMGKIVLELSPDDEHKEWVSKWENTKYNQLYGKLDDMSAEFVWEKTVEMVKEIVGKGNKEWTSKTSPISDQLVHKEG